MEEKRKNFHFQETDWIISFPSTGNHGKKYLYYSVEFKVRDSPSKKVCLVDIVDSPDFEKNFPHIVGFFKGQIGEKGELRANYLELRIIGSVEEFWKFLNDLNI
jgi:hypothetical protein